MLVRKFCNPLMFIHRALLNDAILDSIVSQIGIAVHPHFLEDTGAIRADGLHAQKQLGRDFGNTASCCELAENLEFTLR